jgi:hypothetical protein
VNDLRKRLETLFGRQPSDGLVRFIEAELAQATADALDEAAKHVGNFKMAPGDKWADPFIDALLHRLETEIRALIPADIAAKAKERLSRHCCDICGQDLSGQDFDGHYTIVCHKPGCEDHLASAAHDAKIRREAYLRCAAARCVFCGHTKSPVKKVNGVWVHYAEAVLPTPCDAAAFVEWANEPPSGGKADGGEK